MSPERLFLDTVCIQAILPPFRSALIQMSYQQSPLS